MADPAEITAETERYKARLNFWKAVIVTGVISSAVTVLGTVLNWQIQSAQTEANIALDAQQAERAYLKEFLEQAMQENLPRRIQFAHYFATVAVTAQFRANWSAYHADLLKEQQRKEDELRTEKERLAKLEAASQSGALPAGRTAELNVAQSKIITLQADLWPSWPSSKTGAVDEMLRQWLAQSPENESKLYDWLKRENVDAHLTRFLQTGEFSAHRRRAYDDLNVTADFMRRYLAPAKRLNLD